MKYDVIRKIGEGGQGRVYLVRDRVLDKLWAMKIMPWTRKGQASPKTLPFSIQVMKDFDHPLLPRPVDLFMRPPFLCLVMDYIPGKTLEDLVREQGPRDPQEVRTWARDLLSILDYLHRREPPVFYQDLKPGNILLTTSGEIKLVDFGAIFSPVEAGLGREGEATPGYAGPELYGQGPIGPWTDLYSLGMTLHFLLTGEDPKAEDFSPPRDGPAGSLEAVIYRATQALPKDRYDSCRAFLEALDGEDGPVRRGSRKLLLVLGGIFLALVLLIEGGRKIYRNLIFEGEIRSGREEAVLEAVRLRPDLPLAYEVLLNIYRKDGAFQEEEIETMEALLAPIKNQKGDRVWSRFYFRLASFYLKSGGRDQEGRALSPMAVRARPHFERALEDPEEGWGEVARFRLLICRIHEKILFPPKRTEPGASDFKWLLHGIRQGLEGLKDREEEDRVLFLTSGFWALERARIELESQEFPDLQAVLVQALKKAPDLEKMGPLKDRVLNYIRERR